MSACPKCSAELGGSPKFCPECGEPVTTTTQTAAPVSVAPAGDAAAGGFAAMLKRYSLAIVAVVVVLGIGGLLAANLMRPSSSPNQPTSGATSSADADKVKLAAGLSAFNKVAKKYYLPLAKAGKLYASVGWAADYPDQMLVTVVQPLMQGDGSVFQFMFLPSDVEGGVAPRPLTSSAASLPESVKQWNAHVDDAGNVLLDGYEQQSLASGGSSGATQQPPSTTSAPSSTEMVKVPDFVAAYFSLWKKYTDGPLPEETIAGRIEDAGFAADVKLKDDLFAGDTNQTPAAGSQAPKGSTVTLNIGTQGD